MPRSKAFAFSYEGLHDFNFAMQSNNDAIPDSQSEVKENQRIEFKAKLPVLNNKGFKILLGFNYFKEKFNFEDFSEEYHPIQTALEDKSLKSIGGAAYFIKPYRGEKYLVFQLKGDLNGDYSTGDLRTHNYLKTSLSGLYGIKDSEDKSYGFGFSVGYNFGRLSVWPLVAYNNTFNNKWGIEAILPAFAKLRYNLGDKSVLYGGAELHGTSYNLFFEDSTLTDIANPIYLSQSEVRLFLNYEQEIYDFLWFGVQAGLRENIEFTLSSENTFRNDPFATNDLGTSTFFNASIFLVVPKKYIK